MAQATILAAGTTAATSTDVVVAAGSVVTLGLFASTAFQITGEIARVLIDTPGADTGVGVLTTDKPTTVVSGPGTFRVARGGCSQAIGVYSET